MLQVLEYCTLLKPGHLSNNKQIRTVLHSAQPWASVTGMSAAFYH